MILLVGAFFALSGCGGGGGEALPIMPVVPSPIVQTSVVDGFWTRENSNSFGGGTLSFSNSKVTGVSWLGTSTTTSNGTFTVSGNNLSINYTSSSSGFGGIQTLDEILKNPPQQVSTTNTTVSYTFTVTATALALTDSKNVTVNYKK